MRSLILILILVFSAPSMAAQFCQSALRLDDVTTVQFGPGYSETEVSAIGVDLLIWNVHKVVDSNLPQDFAKIGKNADLVLFQESVNDPTTVAALTAARPDLEWTMAKSFQQTNGSFTGVASASKVEPISEKTLVSSVTETFLGTPKTTIIQEFKIENRGDTLLVVNVHAINFVTNATFEAHMQQIHNAVETHRGPMIFAGDFNTWKGSRLQILEEITAKLKLTPVQLPKSGMLDLDHIYVRGMVDTNTKNLKDINSSDHKPRYTHLNWLPQPQIQTQILPAPIP